jgi:trigger factor
MTNPMNFLPVPEVKYTQKSAILGEFQVNVHPTLIQAKMHDAFQRLQQKVAIPGFRKGKVPMDLVKKKYHEDVLHDVFNQVVTETYRKAAVDNKVRVASDPYITQTNLNDWKEGTNLQYTAQVDLIPEVEIKKYKGLPITKKEGKIENEDVEVVIRNLLDKKAELINLPAETKVKDGHQVIIDFEGKLNGNVIADATAKNFMLEVGGQNSLEDFQKGLKGMKSGDSKEIAVKYPEDYRNPDIAGKEVIYTVTLHEVKEKKYPELTDEMAKEFQAESAEDLRKKVRESLEAELANEQKQQNMEEILVALLESNPFEVPGSLVQRQLEYILSDEAEMLKRQKFGDGLIQEYLRKYSSEYQKRAEREVRLALLLPKVVEKEKISATDEDFKARFDEIVLQSGQPAEAVEKFYKENTQRRDEVAREIERRKAVQVLLDQAKAK